MNITISHSTLFFFLLISPSTVVSAADLLVPRQFPTIQAAITAATAGDTILVSPGTYANVFTISKPINLVGVKGSAATILDPQGAGNALITVSTPGSNATMEGFTIRNAGGEALAIKAPNFSVADCIFENNVESGTVSLGSTSDGGVVSIDSCTFSGNRSSNGAAIRQFASSTSLIACTGCDFIDNRPSNEAVGSAGGAVLVQVGGSFTECTFQQNSAGLDDGTNGSGRGGAIECGSLSGIPTPSLTLVDCVFTENTNSAVFMTKGAATVTGCSFAGNTTATFGGALYMLGGDLTIEECDFSENAANSGGAINITGMLIATNCTFTENSATGFSGAITMIGGGSLPKPQNELTGCDFIQNSSLNGGGAITVGFSVALDVTGCTIEENEAAAGGGVLVLSGTEAQVTFTNSTICDNSADNVDGEHVDGGGNTICVSGLDSDINGDGVVDGADLGLLLAAWNTTDATTDLNNDITTDGADLGILIANWT
jgi:predicted outer membrane repeat protein